MNKYFKSKAVLFNTFVSSMALMESQTRLLESLVGSENMPYLILVITIVNVYLQSVKAEVSKDTKG